MAVASWKPMGAVSKSDDFAYMFQFRTGDGGYVLEVTDMTCLWKEAVSKQNLIRRARTSNCPIDPSQDEQQLETLLRHLTKGLLSEPAAETECHVEKDQKYLQIDIECKMPAGLQPLKWSFTAEQQNPVAFRNQILMPLVEKVNAKTGTVNELFRLLAEKDAAIGNVLDKVDGSGIDLTNLFPTANANRMGRKTDRKAQLRSAVKGLRPFEVSAFLEQQQQNKPDHAKTMTELVRAALSAESGTSGADASEQMHVRTSSLTERSRQTGEQEPVVTNTESHKTAAIDPKVRTDLPRKPGDEDDTTEDEDDLDVLPKNSISARLDSNIESDSGLRESEQIDTSHVPKESTEVNKNHNTGGKKLGKIGGRRPRMSNLEDTSEGNASSEAEAKSRSTEHLDQSVTPTRKKPKLGAIGGKKTGNATADDNEKPQSSPNRASNTRGIETTDSPRKPASSSTPAADGVPTKISLNADSAEDIDPKQAADQKREALKRNLEVQSKMHSKKKRKF